MNDYHIYIVLTKTQSIFSNLVSIIKKDTYTHSTISFNNNIEVMYGFGRKYQYNPIYGVFRTESLDEGFLGKHHKLPGAILDITVTEEQYNKCTAIVNEFIENKSKYKYNLVGVCFSLVGKSIIYNHKFFCSEFVYYALYESGIIDFGMPRSFVRPQNFLNNKNFKVMFEGNLKSLRPSGASS